MTGSVLMLLVAMLHFYWGLGGKWLMTSVVPVKADGERVFNPSPLGTLAVSFGLFAVSFCSLVPLIYHPHRSMRFALYVSLVFCVVFLLRFIGDFRYVGFFRRVKGTDFAEHDTIIYTPLSLFFSISCGFSAYLF